MHRQRQWKPRVKNVSELQAKYNSLRLSVQRQRQELSQAGINTRNLAHDERGLKKPYQ